VSDLTVRIKAIDEASPKIRRLQRRLWWMQYGPVVAQAAVAALAIASFVLGRVTA